MSRNTQLRYPSAFAGMKFKLAGAAIVMALMIAVFHAVYIYDMPFHSDTFWIFRTINAKDLSSATSTGPSVMGAFPGSSLQTFIKFSEVSGRWNYLDWSYYVGLFSFEITSTPNAVRLIQLATIYLSLLLAVFLLLKTGFTTAESLLAVWPSLTFPIPLFVLANHPEPRAQLFLVLAVLFATFFDPQKNWSWFVSGLLAATSSLFKESFIVFLLLPIFVLAIRCNGAPSLRSVNFKLLKKATWFMAPIAAIIAFVVVFKHFAKTRLDYVNMNNSRSIALRLINRANELLNVLSQQESLALRISLVATLALAIGVLLFCLLSKKGAVSPAKLRLAARSTPLTTIAFIVLPMIGVALHLFVFVKVDRPLSGQYQVPMILLFGMITAALVRMIREFTVGLANFIKPLFSATILVACITSAYAYHPVVALDHFTDRINFFSWDHFTQEVFNANPDKVAVQFQTESCMMIEEAMSLQTDIILRSETVFPFEFKCDLGDSTLPPYVKSLTEEFNRKNVAWLRTDGEPKLIVSFSRLNKKRFPEIVQRACSSMLALNESCELAGNHTVPYVEFAIKKP